jgi:hypothetical protein
LFVAGGKRRDNNQRLAQIYEARAKLSGIPMTPEGRDAYIASETAKRAERRTLTDRQNQGVAFRDARKEGQNKFGGLLHRRNAGEERERIKALPPRRRRI